MKPRFSFSVLIVGLLIAAFMIMRSGHGAVKSDPHVLGTTGTIPVFTGPSSVGDGLMTQVGGTYVRGPQMSLNGVAPSGPGDLEVTTINGVAPGGGSTPNLGGDVTFDASAGPNPVTLNSTNTPGWNASNTGPAGIRIINWAGVVTQIVGVDATGAPNGRLLMLWPDGNVNNTLAALHESGSSPVPTNRFHMSGLVNVSLTSVGGLLFRYSTANNRWNLIGSQ